MRIWKNLPMTWFRKSCALGWLWNPHCFYFFFYSLSQAWLPHDVVQFIFQVNKTITYYLILKKKKKKKKITVGGLNQVNLAKLGDIDLGPRKGSAHPSPSTFICPSHSRVYIVYSWQTGSVAIQLFLLMNFSNWRIFQIHDGRCWI